MTTHSQTESTPISAESKPNTSRRFEQGFEVFILANELVELALVPALGAKVISLRNLVTGYEWMWHPPTEIKLFHNRPGDDFATSTLVGWDECLPTIAPCLHQGRHLPDHGEVWSVPWAIDWDAWRRGHSKTAVKLQLSPLDFERTIELRGNVIHLRYQLTNRAAVAEKFLWAMHALAPTPPGGSLELTPEARQQLGNPPWLAGMNFEKSEPACVKTYAGPLDEGRAAILNSASGDRLTFRWDTRLNDTVGVWLTRGGWHGHHHVALEPSNGYPDDLTTAELHGRCGIISANARLEWEVAMQIDPCGRKQNRK